jgi:hypothetical protein
MVAQIVLVPAFADGLARSVDDDASHGRIGRSDTDAPARNFECALHPVAIPIEFMAHANNQV